MNKVLKIAECCGSFAENKDSAREMRESILRPAIETPRQKVVLDFEGVDSSTQSFIHALLSDLLQSFGEKALDRIQFKNCSKSIKSLITAVVSYSLE